MNKILLDIRKHPKEKQIQLLEAEIKRHNKKYFVENNPEISDTEFDEITEYLRSLKPNSPVLFEIVGDIGNIKHPTPMLSIAKKYTHDDIKKWLDTVDDNEYIVEPKYDGMAARYYNGLLATRGNGLIGEDLSPKFRYLTIVGEIKKDKSNYGEIIIPLSYFNENLKQVYKNPRNAVVGIMKSKSPTEEGIKALNDGGVHFVIHDSAKKLIVTPKELIDEESWESILEIMFQTDYPLDGIVIKATSNKIKNKLGTTQHHARWQVAYKVPAERKWSTVKDIKDQVGRTGRVTSVAIIEPINLSGATVTNITLHNASFVESSGIDIGSKVEVCRSGEVIPFITKIQQKEETKHRQYKLPQHCPICKHPLKREDKYITCTNKKCPARKALSIEYFFKTIGVENLGIRTVERFINELGATDILDYYKLTINDISKLDNFGTKSAKRIVEAIQSTLKSSITPTQLLQAFGIKDIGPATSKMILDMYEFDQLPSLTTSDLTKVPGIGPKKALYLQSVITEKWGIVIGLKKLGLKFKTLSAKNLLHGKTFCITGKKASKTRNELIKLVETNGGVYKKSVTKGLDYLIAGKDAGSKLEKAQTLGIPIITERDFLDMIKTR